MRFGRWYKAITPGPVFTIPFFDALHVLNVRRQVLDFPCQVVRTTDRTELVVSGFCVYAIRDPVKVFVDVQDHDDALATLGMDLIAQYISTHEDNDCKRHQIIEAIQKELRKEGFRWGCEVERFGLYELARCKVWRFIGGGPSFTEA